MIYKSLFDMEIKIEKPRDSMTERQLSITGVAELAAQRIIHKELDDGKTAKAIYKIVQEEMGKYADIVGKSTIIDMISNKQIRMEDL